MKTDEIDQQIPFFSLYGEALKETEPGFVHLESIAERSSEAGWHIRPHRHHNMLQMLMIERGEAQILLDQSAIELKQPGLIYTPAEVVHGFNFQPNTQGWVLSVALTLFNDMMDQNPADLDVSTLRQPGVLSLDQDPETRASASQLLRMLTQEYRRQNQYSLPLLSHLISALFLLYVRALNARQVIQNQTSSSSQFQQFIALLDAQYTQHHPIEWYAQQLNTSLSTLNRVCRSAIGKSSKTLIAERLILEAKRRLIYTQASVESIAFALGYKDPGYFSRFFSKQAGLPPGQYRKQNSQTSSV